MHRTPLMAGGFHTLAPSPLSKEGCSCAPPPALAQKVVDIYASPAQHGRTFTHAPRPPPPPVRGKVFRHAPCPLGARGCTRMRTVPPGGRRVFTHEPRPPLVP